MSSRSSSNTVTTPQPWRKQYPVEQIADSVPVNSHDDGVCAVRRTSGSGSRPRRRCAPHRGMNTRYLEARLADIRRMSVSEKERVEPASKANPSRYSAHRQQCPADILIKVSHGRTVPRQPDERSDTPTSDLATARLPEWR